MARMIYRPGATVRIIAFTIAALTAALAPMAHADCRIVAKNATLDNLTSTGSGQVGAPCGCIGLFDEFTHIQGNWVHVTVDSPSRFKADDFNSLVCGCESCPAGSAGNLACFSGTGTYFFDGTGQTGLPVAYRVEVEDHGGSTATPDEYRIWIYIPGGGETTKGLAVNIGCENTPSGNTNRAADMFGAGRVADFFDGGNVAAGNIRIKPQIASHEGICPAGVECPAPLP